MNNQSSEIVCVIDRSGSMDAIRTDAIGGFNSFLKEQQQTPGNAQLTLVLFNDQYKLICDGQHLNAVSPLTDSSFVPRGRTALFDAIGRTIDTVGNRLAQTPESERPKQVIFAILTDGQENASKMYTQQHIFDLIKHQREVYSWSFVFLAANQDAMAAAESIAISKDDAMDFEATAEGVTHSFHKMSRRVMENRQK